MLDLYPSAVIEEMVLVRYCEQGEIRSRFVSLEPVEKGNAVNITAAMKQACQAHLQCAGDDFKTKLVGFLCGNV